MKVRTNEFNRALKIIMAIAPGDIDTMYMMIEVNQDSITCKYNAITSGASIEIDAYDIRKDDIGKSVAVIIGRVIGVTKGMEESTEIGKNTTPEIELNILDNKILEIDAPSYLVLEEDGEVSKLKVTHTTRSIAWQSVTESNKMKILTAVDYAKKLRIEMSEKDNVTDIDVSSLVSILKKANTTNSKFTYISQSGGIIFTPDISYMACVILEQDIAGNICIDSNTLNTMRNVLTEFKVQDIRIITNDEERDSIVLLCDDRCGVWVQRSRGEKANVAVLKRYTEMEYNDFSVLAYPGPLSYIVDAAAKNYDNAKVHIAFYEDSDDKCIMGIGARNSQGEKYECVCGQMVCGNEDFDWRRFKFEISLKAMQEVLGKINEKNVIAVNIGFTVTDEGQVYVRFGQIVDANYYLIDGTEKGLKEAITDHYFMACKVSR